MILKVTATAICGSDLHLYLNALPGMKAGDLLGHEVREGVRPQTCFAHSKSCSIALLPHARLAHGR